MPFDLATVNWVYVAVLAVLVFISTLVGSLLSFKHSGRAAVLSALVFAALFVFWTYYPAPHTGAENTDDTKCCELTGRHAHACSASYTCRARRPKKSGHGHYASRKSCALASGSLRSSGNCQ